MDGIIIINKEKGYTSNDVVQIVKKIFNEKVGHTGTLDPMATGVLPLLVGIGTQLSKYLINHDKIYQATLSLGQKMDTGDIEGNVIEEKEVQSFLYSIINDPALTKKENQAKQMRFFKVFYNLLFGQDSGPRLYLFLAAVDKNKYLHLLQF